MRPLITDAAIAMWGGCAAPPTIVDAVPAPASRLLTLQAEDQGKDATLTAVRESAVRAGHCFFGVFIDGKLAARLDNNEKATFHVKPGRRLVGVGPTPKGQVLAQETVN